VQNGFLLTAKQEAAGMGGITYRTKQGDMWDYIAWKIYGSEDYVNVLYDANPQYLKEFIFEDGIEITCPEINIEDDTADAPEWRDNEDLEADALDGVSDKGEEEDG